MKRIMGVCKELGRAGSRTPWVMSRSQTFAGAWVMAMALSWAAAAQAQDATGTYNLAATTTSVRGPNASLVPGTWTGDFDLVQSGAALTGTGTLNGQSVTVGFGGVTSIFIGFEVLGYRIGDTLTTFIFRFDGSSPDGTFDTIGGSFFGNTGGTNPTSWSGNFTMVRTVVPPPNVPPTVVLSPAATAVTLSVGQTYTLLVTASNPARPGEVVTIFGTGFPPISSFTTTPGNPATAVINVTPTAPGTYPATITATGDGTPPLSTSVTVMFTITPPSPPPPLEFQNPMEALAHFRATVNQVKDAALHRCRRIAHQAIKQMDGLDTAARFVIRDAANAQIDIVTTQSIMLIETAHVGFENFLDLWVADNPGGAIQADGAKRAGIIVDEHGKFWIVDKDTGAKVPLGQAATLNITLPLEDILELLDRELQRVARAAIQKVDRDPAVSAEVKKRTKEAIMKMAAIAAKEKERTLAQAKSEMAGPGMTAAGAITVGGRASDTMVGIVAVATSNIEQRAEKLCDLKVEILGLEIDPQQRRDPITHALMGLAECGVTVRWVCYDTDGMVTVSCNWSASNQTTLVSRIIDKGHGGQILPVERTSFPIDTSALALKQGPVQVAPGASGSFTGRIAGPEYAPGTAQTITFTLQATVTGVDTDGCKDQDSVETQFTIAVRDDGTVIIGPNTKRGHVLNDFGHGAH